MFYDWYFRCALSWTLRTYQMWKLFSRLSINSHSKPVRTGGEKYYNAAGTKSAIASIF